MEALTEEFVLTPEEFEAAYQRTRRMLGVGRAQDACSILEALTLLAPRVPRVLCAMGLAYMRCKRYREALPVLKRAVDIRPHDPVAPLLFAECVLFAHGADLARPLLVAALQQSEAAGGADAAARHARRLMEYLKPSLLEAP